MNTKRQTAVRYAGAIALMAVLTGLVGCPLVPNDRDLQADRRPALSPEFHVISQRPDRLVSELPNRMVVITQRIETAPVVSAQVWIKTGSIYEQQHNGAGLSHFLEHLLSGGSTRTRTEEESNLILGRMGAQTNAATGLDSVRYYINTHADHAHTAVDLLGDWMRHSLITEAEYERERQVIQREFEMGAGDPNRILWKLTQQARYTAHPARHPTIGYLDEFKTITRDEIYDFYRRMYVPNNMVFVVVGDIDPREMTDHIAERWAGEPIGELPEIAFPIEGELEAPRRATGHADIDRPRVRLAFPGTRLAAEGDYALDLLAQVLGQGELSRLVRSVRDEKRLATDIQAYNLSFAWGEGFFGVDAVTTEDQLDEVRAAVFAEIERLQREGIGETELARAKRKTLAGVVYNAQTAAAAASRLARDFIHTGDPDYLDRYAERIQAITADQVQAAAGRFLIPDRCVTLHLLPQAEAPKPLARPEEPAIDLPVERVDLDNARLIQRARELGALDESERTIEVEPIKMVTLGNGLRVLVQRNTQLPLVSIQWYHLGGLLADEPGREGVAHATCQMRVKGAGDLSADDIARRVEDLGAQLQTHCGNSTFYGSAQCLSDDWPSVLDLFAKVMIAPTFPEDEWRKMQPRLIAAIDSIDDTWHGELRSAFRKAYFGEDDPWSQDTLGRRETIESLDAESLAEFHKRNLAASDCVVTVFGDVDPAEAIDAVSEHFSAMPAQRAAPFDPRPHREVQPRRVTIDTAKPMAAVQMGYAPGLARDNEDYPAMLVMTRVLSNFPSGWLEQALRGRGPGLVYAVGAGQMTGLVPGYWAVLFNTQPATLDPAIEQARGVVDRIRSTPVDEVTLNRARQAVRVSEALGQQSNAQRAAGAALDELYGVGYRGPEQLIERIQQVDAERVQAVAQRYLGEPLIVVIRPEAAQD